MRFVRGNVKDRTDSPKSTTDLRNGAKERCSGRELQKSTFARFSLSFDFRLLQHYRAQTDTSDLERTPTETSTQRDSSSNAMASLLREDSH
jgi:hypothetical protein